MADYYSRLLQSLDIEIKPIGKSNDDYKLVKRYIDSGKSIQSDYNIECIDIFEAKRKEDKSIDFKYDKTSLLWYGCLTSSVAAKLKKGINKSYNKFTSYKAISLFDNIVPCCKDIGLFDFNKQFNTKNDNNSRKLGILMLCEVNYNNVMVPKEIQIDKVKSKDYIKKFEVYNEDDDTDTEDNVNSASNNSKSKTSENDDDDSNYSSHFLKKKKFSINNSNSNNNNDIDIDEKELSKKLVYYKDQIKDNLESGQLLKINGLYSPSNNDSVTYNNNVSVPLGTPTHSALSNINGWVNGHLKVFGDQQFNQYLISNSKMLKLKFLIMVSVTQTKSSTPTQIPKQIPKQTTSTNNQNLNSIWNNVLIKPPSSNNTNTTTSSKKRNLESSNEDDIVYKKFKNDKDNDD